jgi:hypothetical protein
MRVGEPVSHYCIVEKIGGDGHPNRDVFAVDHRVSQLAIVAP